MGSQAPSGWRDPTPTKSHSLRSTYKLATVSHHLDSTTWWSPRHLPLPGLPSLLLQNPPASQLASRNISSSPAFKGNMHMCVPCCLLVGIGLVPQELAPMTWPLHTLALFQMCGGPKLFHQACAHLRSCRKPWPAPALQICGAKAPQHHLQRLKHGGNPFPKSLWGSQWDGWKPGCT